MSPLIFIFNLFSSQLRPFYDKHRFHLIGYGIVITLLLGFGVANAKNKSTITKQKTTISKLEEAIDKHEFDMESLQATCRSNETALIDYYEKKLEIELEVKQKELDTISSYLSKVRPNDSSQSCDVNDINNIDIIVNGMYEVYRSAIINQSSSKTD